MHNSPTSFLAGAKLVHSGIPEIIGQGACTAAASQGCAGGHELHAGHYRWHRCTVHLPRSVSNVYDGSHPDGAAPEQ